MDIQIETSTNSHEPVELSPGVTIQPSRSSWDYRETKSWLGLKKALEPVGLDVLAGLTPTDVELILDGAIVHRVVAGGVVVMWRKVSP